MTLELPVGIVAGVLGLWGHSATRADAMRLRTQLLLDWPELQGCYSVRRAP